MAKIYQIAFELAGKLKDSFGASIGGATQKLSQLHNSVTNLKSVKDSIDRFDKLSSALQKNQAELQRTDEKIARLTADIANTSDPTRKMTDDLERAISKSASLTSRINEQSTSLSSLKDKLASAGVSTSNLATENERLTKMLNNAKKEQDRLQTLQSAKEKNRQDRGDYYTKAIDTAAMTGALAMPLKAYADLNQAQTDLEMAIMTKHGVPPQFKEMRDIAVDLGNDLPGTTADFFQLGRALAENGMKTETIVSKGGAAFRSAAHLAVVMHQTPEAAGAFVAKMREAYQLSEEELPKMADYTQRIKAAFGVNMEEFKTASEYIAAPLGDLNVKGAEATQTIATLMGLFAQNGLAGQKAGTGIKELLSGMLKYKDLMQKNSKEAKHFRKILSENGVKMEFFKDGKFAGLENMLVQLEKLKKIGDDEKRLEVIEKLFGDEGMSAASIASRVGKRGLEAGLNRMNEVASLDEKIKKAVGTYKNSLEAIQGTMVNLWAAIGEPIAQLAIPKINSMNESLGKLQNLYEAHPIMKTTVGLLGSLFTGLVALRVATLAFGYSWSIITGGWLAAQSLLFVVSNSVIGIRVGLMALAAWQGIVTAAQWAWNAAMMVGSIGLAVIVGAIALVIAAGVLLYTHWDTVKAKFFEVWDGIKNWFSSLNLYESGVKLLRTFADGIVAAKDYLMDKFVGILKALREYMPFSDAKTGPLSQLTESGRKVIETFGQGISSASGIGGTFAEKVGIDSMSSGLAFGGAGGGSVIHFAPVINIASGSGDVRGDVVAGLRTGADDLQSRIEQMNRNRRRLSYD